MSWLTRIFPHLDKNPWRRPNEFVAGHSILESWGGIAMKGRLRSIRLRTLLIGVAALALLFAAIHETVIWAEKRKFIDFHEARAQLLLDRAAQYRSSRPDVSGEYRRLATWHADRADEYRRAHKIYFSDEMTKDFQQTGREQSFERSLSVGGVGGKPVPMPATGS
jgi:hypothetical protein